MAKSEAGQIEDRFQLVVDDLVPGYEYEGGRHRQPSPTQTEQQPPREEVYYFPVGSRAELRCIQAFDGIHTFDRLYLMFEMEFCILMTCLLKYVKSLFF